MTRRIKYCLSTREQSRGRGLKPVEPDGGIGDPLLAGEDRLVFFVHGYNNNRVRAAKVWATSVAWLDDHGFALDDVVLFFWPGDKFRSRSRSAFAYHEQIPVARDTAKQLVRYLLHRRPKGLGRLRISFVAHSLGSLVVLHTLALLRRLDTRPSIEVEDVLLMAAAVPVGYCRPPARYDRPFAPDAPRETVLSSLRDGVLKKPFRMGQWRARNRPAFERQAVGRNGGPPRRWDTVPMSYHRHGDYWTAVESLEFVARVVDKTRDLQPHPRPFKKRRLRWTIPLPATVPEASLPKGRVCMGALPDC